MTLTRSILVSALLLPAIIAGCTSREAPPTALQGTTTGAGMEIGFRSEPDPPASGTNTFEVTVKKDGAPVPDANVAASFSMPAMPSMNMPAMQSRATLAPQGGGRYRGEGRLSMAGTWNVKVTITQGSQEIGTRSFSIVAR